MQWRNSRIQYGLIAQLLHWSVVGLVIVQVLLAERAETLPVSLERLQLLARHKSFGMTVFMLMAVRLIWRLVSPPPPLPPQRSIVNFFASLTHWGFYGLLLAIPLSGWILSSASNLSVSWFGLFAWPDLVATDEALRDSSKVVHQALVVCLLLVIGLHTGAALVHQFVWRDGLLRRMLPFKSSPGDGP